MKISISEDAAKWYKEELDLNDGDSLRFYIRYGGCSNVQKGFSLGVEKGIPNEIGSQAKKLGITFYIEKDDLWYFENQDVSIELDQDIKEPVFHFSN